MNEFSVVILAFVLFFTGASAGVAFEKKDFATQMFSIVAGFGAVLMAFSLV